MNATCECGMTLEPPSRRTGCQECGTVGCRSCTIEMGTGTYIEDQRFPKRCGHIAGKTVVSLEEALGKYRAAVDTRDRLDPDFVIIARTDAQGAVGGSLEEAIRRARAYADAGVDLVWCELSNAAREPAIAFAGALRA